MKALTKTQVTSHLKLCPLFNGLSGRQLGTIANHARQDRFKAESVITKQGSAGNWFFIVIDGVVSVERDGKLLKTMSQGGYFGEISLIDGRLRTASIIAESDVDVLIIDKTSFSRLLKTVPGLQEKVLMAVCSYLRKAESTLHGLNDTLDDHLGMSYSGWVNIPE